MSLTRPWNEQSLSLLWTLQRLALEESFSGTKEGDQRQTVGTMYYMQPKYKQDSSQLP